MWNKLSSKFSDSSCFDYLFFSILVWLIKTHQRTGTWKGSICRHASCDLRPICLQSLLNLLTYYAMWHSLCSYSLIAWSHIACGVLAAAVRRPQFPKSYVGLTVFMQAVRRSQGFLLAARLSKAFWFFFKLDIKLFFRNHNVATTSQVHRKVTVRRPCDGREVTYG